MQIDSCVPATTIPSYDVPNKSYSKTSGDERNFIQLNEVIQQSYGEENKRDTNPSYRVNTREDRVTAFSTTLDTKAHQSSHDDTTKEYDYVYAHGHHGHLLHHNTAASTTGW